MFPSNCILWSLIVTSLFLVKVEGSGLGRVEDRKWTSTLSESDLEALLHLSSEGISGTKKPFRSMGADDSPLLKALNTRPEPLRPNTVNWNGGSSYEDERSTSGSESDWLQPAGYDRNIDDILQNPGPISSWNPGSKNGLDVGSGSRWDSATGSVWKLDSGNSWIPGTGSSWGARRRIGVRPGPSNVWRPEPSNRWRPGSSNILRPGPSNSWRPGPSNSWRPGPSNSWRPGPSKNLKPGPSKSWRPGPSNSRKPGPSNSRRPGPSNSWRPGPSKNLKPGPSKSWRPGRSNSWKPSPSNVWKPSPSNIWKPSPSNIQKPGPSKSARRPDNDKIYIDSRGKVTPGSTSALLLGGWNGPNVIGDWARPRVNSVRQIRKPAVRW